MTPAYTFKMPPPSPFIETMPMPRPMPPPPPFNPGVGGRIRIPEPDEGEDLTDLMRYYQPETYAPPMQITPMSTMFGGVTMPPGPMSEPPFIVGPGQQLPTITSGQGVGPDPRYRPYTPPPQPQFPTIEPMPIPRRMPQPPPRNYDIGGKIRMPEPDEPEGNAFFTL